MLYRYCISAFITLIFTAYFKFAIVDMMKAQQFTVKNYSGTMVVNGGGLILLFPCLFGILSFWEDNKVDLLVYANVIFASLFMGLIDDFFGNNHPKGFKGHLRKIAEKQLTTGVLKILIGVIAGFIASSAYYSTLRDIAFHTILFALCVNFINLMDLRPGRAIKAFLTTISLIAVFIGLKGFWILFPLILALIVYLPGEMREEYMLGDTGASLLGGILGLYAINIFQSYVKLTAFFALMLIHIVAEFYSLSEIIDRISILKSIDNIGRLKKER